MSALPKNEARNAEIIKHRRAGRWPHEIAKMMGLTRSTVLGVLDRAGLCDAHVNRAAAMECRLNSSHARWA